MQLVPALSTFLPFGSYGFHDLAGMVPHSRVQFQVVVRRTNVGFFDARSSSSAYATLQTRHTSGVRLGPLNSILFARCFSESFDLPAFYLGLPNPATPAYARQSLTLRVIPVSNQHQTMRSEAVYLIPCDRCFVTPNVSLKDGCL